jgi:antitoxin VapB
MERGRREVSPDESRSAAGDGGWRLEQIMLWLETEVWPKIPPSERGRRLTRGEEDEILGYGPDGV